MDSSLRHISHLPEHQLSDSEITIEHLQSERASAMQITECFSSFNPQNHPLQSAKGSLFPSPLFAWERTNNPTIQHGTPQRGGGGPHPYQILLSGERLRRNFSKCSTVLRCPNVDARPDMKTSKVSYPAEFPHTRVWQLDLSYWWSALFKFRVTWSMF